MLKKEVELPNPNVFLGSIGIVEESRLQDAEALRNCSSSDAIKAYVDFLFKFGRCLILRKEWGRRCKSEMFTQFIPPTLEAFGVLVYYNNFKFWKNEFDKSRGDDDSVDSSEKLEVRPIFTTDTKCKRRTDGWSPEGIVFYNKLVIALKYQRKTIQSKTIDRFVMEKCVTESSGKMGKGRRTVIAIADVDAVSFT